MIDKRYHLYIAGFYCVIAMIIATITSVVWSVSGGVSMLIWFVVTILFSIVHGLYIGGIFFKRSEEVLIDLEDSHNFIHSEVDTVRSAISEFSQSLEKISHQQDALNQKNQEFIDVNTHITETLKQINSGLETQKTDIAGLHDAVNDIKSRKELLQPQNNVTFTKEIPQPPQQDNAVADKDISSHNLLNEEFDSNEIPEFLANDEDALLDLNEDFFIDGMSEEFSEETQKKRDIVAQSLEGVDQNLDDEEFADITDMLQNVDNKEDHPVQNNPVIPETSSNTHHEQPEDNLQGEEFVESLVEKPQDTLAQTTEGLAVEQEEFIDAPYESQPDQSAKIDKPVTKQQDIYEEEFLNDADYLFSDHNTDVVTSPKKTVQKKVKAKSDFVRSIDADNAPLPSLTDLIPQMPKAVQSQAAALTQKSALPSLDQLLNKQKNNHADTAHDKSMALRADNIPAINQKPLDQDVDAAIAELQQQAKMPELHTTSPQENNAPANIDNVMHSQDEAASFTTEGNAQQLHDTYENAAQQEEQNPISPSSSDHISSGEKQLKVNEQASTPLVDTQNEHAHENIAQASPAQSSNTHEAPTLSGSAADKHQKTQDHAASPLENHDTHVASPQEHNKELIFADTPPDDMITTLRYALEHNAIDTYIRTILDPITQDICYLEGVNYLRDEAGEYHPPKVFEHAASKLGLDKTIDQILVTRIVQTVRALSNIGKKLRIFTNISVKTLCDAAFEEELLDMVQEKSNMTESIIFEITQKQLSYLNSVRLEKLKYLAECGFEFSLDHITQELPDLKELYLLGFKFIKVSPQILDLGINISGQTVAGKELRRLCASYDIKLIVEGVNVHNDLLTVMNYGADFVQGEMIAPLERLDQLNIDVL